MKTYRVVVADDHSLFRQGLRRIIESVPELTVVGEAQSGNALLLLLASVETEMVILDISMPNRRGIDTIPEIKAAYPGIKVLILTMHKEYVRQSFGAGADGYLLKEDADRDLFLAIDNIRLGRTYVSSRIAQELVEPRTGSSSSLSNREKEILKLIAQGKSNKESASILFISVRTVESHRARIMSKLSLSSSADIIRYAMQKGLI